MVDKYRILAIQIVLLLVFPAVGLAGPDRVNKALQIAEQKWGPIEPITVERYALPFGYLGFADFTNRRILLRRGHIDWPRFCSTVVHEYGHFVGKPHSDNIYDVMYPMYLYPFKPCGRKP